MKDYQTPEAARLAKMCEHFSTANELKSNVQICCVLLATTTRNFIEVFIYAFIPISVFLFSVPIIV